MKRAGWSIWPKARGLIITAFHNRRWDSDFLGMRAAIEAGTIGQVVHFESRFDRFRPALRDRWREDGGPGSGIWYDLGPHLVDQALVLFGTPLRVGADLAVLRPGGQAHDFAHVTLYYAHARVILQASMVVAGGSPRFIAHGLTGSLIKSGADVQEAQSVAGLTPDAADWGRDPDPLRHIDGEGREHRIAVPHGHQPTFYADLAQGMPGARGPAEYARSDPLGAENPRPGDRLCANRADDDTVIARSYRYHHRFVALRRAFVARAWNLEGGDLLSSIRGDKPEINVMKNPNLFAIALTVSAAFTAIPVAAFAQETPAKQPLADPAQAAAAATSRTGRCAKGWRYDF